MLAELLLPAEDASAFVLAVLSEAGFAVPDATLCADLLVESSLRGIDSHGVTTLLSHYVMEARRGVSGADRPPTLVSERGAVAVVDGGGASGPRAARVALDAVMRLASRQGLGVACASRVGYLGALWWSVLPAARRGLVGLVAVNSPACVAPFGGREPLHGTNPIAIAVPLEPHPIVLDMRTNAFRMADYWEGIRTGAPLPAGGLIRPDGSPVTDPAEADTAVYLPLAGAKGYGLALMIDILTAGLAGGPIGREFAPEADADGTSAFFLAIEPGYFGPRERFLDAVVRLARQVHATAPLEADASVRLPGERAAMERRRRLAHGIPVDPVLWERLADSLRELEIEVPLPALSRGQGA